MKHYRSLCRSHSDNSFSTSWAILLILVTVENFVCMSTGEKIITDQIWLPLCKNQQTPATVAPKAPLYLSAMAIHNFSCIGTIKIVAMDMLGPLPKTTEANQYVVIISDRCSRMTRAVSTTGIIIPAVVCIFLDAWIFSFNIWSNLRTDNGTQIANSLVAFVTISVIKHMTTTTHQS